MSPIHLSFLIAIHLSPNLAGGVGLSACRQLICLPIKQFICLPVWLVVSGSPDVSNAFVSPYSMQFISPSLAGGVRLSGCLQIHFSSLTAIHFSQSGWWCPALRMSPIHLSPLIALIAIHSFVSQSGWWCPALRMSPIHLSPL